ncbi:bacteriocin biosynthesis cyclodehydratase domain-containing protein [Nocardiopsis sp. Huas11]|uniref:TOMM precursor leader peptide-binding protein n=1 Tax=Nocardiopsis sp. Huas11 TaxID=2183912 RepID=UPI000F1402F2|nr:TOMM precursor leader peptide-binding protein [Nocardiopsis sp. Huas11]RKS09260.1 bacteriocin biosynthesis cyclodehydratase domain-containing protein [Nocardiopsis sp. Huas11]
MTALTDSTVLRLAPALSAFYGENSVTLRSGGRNLRYGGGATRLLQRVLPLVDGKHDLGTLIGGLGFTTTSEPGDDRLRPAVFRLCERLVADGMLIDTADAGLIDHPGGLLGEWSRPDDAGEDPRNPVEVLRVVGDPDEVEAIARVTPPHWRVRSATLAEIVGAATPEGVCTAVWVSDPNDPLLSEWNETAYHNRQPWLPIIHFDGETAVVGPYIHPKSTPCFECYRRRRAARHALGADFLELRPLSQERMVSAALTTVLAGLAVASLREWETRSDPHVPGGVRTVTFERGLEIGSEYVLRVPRCPACRPGTAVARPTLWTEYFAPEAAETEETAAP